MLHFMPCLGVKSASHARSGTAPTSMASSAAEKILRTGGFGDPLSAQPAAIADDEVRMYLAYGGSWGFSVSKECHRERLLGRTPRALHVWSNLWCIL